MFGTCRRHSCRADGGAGRGADDDPGRCADHQLELTRVIEALTSTQLGGLTTATSSADDDAAGRADADAGARADDDADQQADGDGA